MPFAEGQGDDAAAAAALSAVSVGEAELDVGVPARDDAGGDVIVDKISNGTLLPAVPVVIESIILEGFSEEIVEGVGGVGDIVDMLRRSGMYRLAETMLIAALWTESMRLYAIQVWLV